MNYQTFVVLASVIASSGISSAIASSTELSIARVEYPIVPSQYVVEITPLSSEIEWIDDARVIFTGHELNSEPSQQREVQKRAIHIFNSKTSTGMRHAVGSLKCFARGRIRYTVTGADRKEVGFAGILGAEKQTPSREQASDTIENKFSCNLHDRIRVPQAFGISARPLLEDHGYLQFTFPVQKTLTDHVLYLRADGVTVPLPIQQKDMTHPQIKWYAHRNAYLFYDWSPSEILDRSLAKPQRVGVPKKLYLLSPDGTLRTIEVPYGKWHRGFGRFYMTSGGVAMVAPKPKQRAGPSMQAVFLLKSDKWELVLDGIGASNAAVSPDGCKLAIAIGAKVGDPSLLRIIDVCASRKTDD